MLPAPKGYGCVKRTVWMMAAACALPCLTLPSGGQAQTGAVVQPIPPAAAVETLNTNLAKLSRSPQDVDALLGAGQAALDLGDVQAANGFFTRANIINPNLGKAKLGLAIVELALKQPEEAAANFDAADRLGEHATGHLADRGLAYDLIGEQAKAQRDYQAALRASPNDEKATLRYAVSLGISGHLAEADNRLKPMLASGNREAWRLRAFIYAMNGRQEDARRITRSVMPAGLADALDPYMARVSLLTPAQKAAAAHYGDFPSDVLRMPAPALAPDAKLATNTKREPSKKEHARKDKTGHFDDAQVRAVAAPPAPTPLDDVPPPPPPAQTLASTDQAQSPPPAAAPLSASQWLGSSERKQAPVVQRVTPPPRPATSGPVPRSSAPPPPRSLADAVSALAVPAGEKRETVVPADMDAVARIHRERAAKEAAAKATAEARAKARAEAELQKKLRANPARIWVQLAAGKNDSALAFSLNRLRKRYESAIGDVSGWTADWGETNRILVGPYRKLSSAKLVVEKVKKAGGDAFVWQSDAGEEVTKIGEK